ncbi:MAG: cell wall-binding repeat-containing protein [Acidimicrobiales bacterium]|nr:cell wall-binding repeat-containing protein [Acidimicrobiales bacterium]
MSFSASLKRRPFLFGGGTALAAAGAVVLALGPGSSAGVASKQAVSPRVRPISATAAPPSTAADPSHPFGAPTGNGDFKVPPPPQEPTLVPTIGTKTTQRLYGADPFQEAVSITQHLWPSAVPLDAASGNDNVPDRPRAVILLTPDDPLTAITATPLVHFPNDAPILYVNKNGIPKVSLNEIKRLGPAGIARYNNVDAFLVGAAANTGVENQLKSIGVKYVTVTAPNVPELANRVDQLYGSIENPDTGVPNMGNGAENVMVGSMDGTDYQFVLPATHWVTHMEAGLLWVNKNGIPASTITALKRRTGQARIYLFGGPNQISGAVAKQLAGYGTIIRVNNDDVVAFNTPPTDTPVDTAIAFAKMWDQTGMVGWKITGPGHGFTLANINDWQGAVASSPLSHLGFHAPLLFTDNAGKLPPELAGYFQSVAPTFLTTPADGPYNMTYVLGSWNQITWPQQASIDNASEMANRRDWNQNTGSRYTDSGQ